MSAIEASAVDAQDLTVFRQNVLLAIAAADGPVHGLGIKDRLDDLYGEPINHSRLYPNLDELVDRGLVHRGKRDERTNNYRLTEAGRQLLVEDTERRAQIVTAIGGEVAP